MPVQFIVDLSEAHSGILKVHMEFPSTGKEEIVMPVWAPGSYLVRDFSRHVSNIESKSVIKQLSKNRWSIVSKGEKAELDYQVYCDELTVDTSYSDQSFALINGTGIFFYPEGRKDCEYNVKFKNYGKWKIATGLPQNKGIYTAEDYDHLVDCPILLGDIQLMEFTVMNKKHIIAWQGRMIRDKKEITEDFRKIVEAEGKIFGKLPYDKYFFLIITVPDEYYGGLEHKNSTAILYPEYKLLDDFEYKLFLTTVSHEFFHTWNVKRIRPKELGPFDYTKEVHTNLLWLSEGFTSYYEWLILWRAGLVKEDEYMKHISKMIDYYQLQPGHTLPADSSSFNTWVKLYKPDGNVINTYISYYLKGELIAFALNSEIIKATKGQKSLDDVFRGLFADFNRNGKGIEKKDLIEQVSRLMGVDAGKFVNKLTETTAEINFNQYLNDLGYRVSRKYPDKKTGSRGFLGAIISTDGGKIVVKNVISGYPAQKAGVLPGDELVAINGQRFTETFTRSLGKELRSRKVDSLKHLNPGDEVDLYAFRKNNFFNFKVKAAEEPKETVVIKEKNSRIKAKMLSG
ncbi:MAG: PDZ domain-containing protein [Thermoplasmatales archaeon]